VKGYWLAFKLWEWGRWVLSEEVEEVLIWVIENDFVILPCMNRTHLHCNIQRRDLGFADCCPWMQLEVVIHCYGFFA
jgi:hypothetical protein